MTQTFIHNNNQTQKQTKQKQIWKYNGQFNNYRFREKLD